MQIINMKFKFQKSNDLVQRFQLDTLLDQVKTINDNFSQFDFDIIQQCNSITDLSEAMLNQFNIIKLLF